jgi:hypothetical protein
MKNISILSIIVFSFFSCGKRDTINHYLTQPITQQELVENGFYRYSYTSIFDDKGNKVTDTTRFPVKYDMYSNVKPQRDENGELCPTQLVKLDNEIHVKEKNNYLKNELDNRIITYLFRNDTLFYKNIVVYSINKFKKGIADLTSKEKIMKYYDSLKVSIKPMFDDKKNDEAKPFFFMINNYKMRIYYSEENQSYDMFVNYLIDSDNYNVLEDWYSGYLSKKHYVIK